MEEKMNGRFNDLASMLKQFNALSENLAEKYGDIIDEEKNKSAGSDDFDKEKDDNTTEPQA